MFEATCNRCGETFNPSGDETTIVLPFGAGELVEHYQTFGPTATGEYEVECGGFGLITGEWGTPRAVDARPYVAPVFDDWTYRVEHGTNPRGVGSWAFGIDTDNPIIQAGDQPDVLWAHGTLTEAKRQTRRVCRERNLSGVTLYVLP